MEDHAHMEAARSGGCARPPRLERS